jgi:glycosyltransferase involved in cell wall biosynthesis
VGTVEPRKNLVRLLEAFNALTAAGGFGHGLVITGGKGWHDAAILKALETIKARDRVFLTGFVPAEELPALYSLADLVVYPSLYEGFGMPVLEAMACGTPVVTSNVSSLPEVAGDAALLVDPHSTDDLVDAIRKGLRDEGLRSAMRQKGLVQASRFSWEKSAQQALTLFEEAAQL